MSSLLTFYRVELAENFRDLGYLLASKVTDFHLTMFRLIYILCSEIVCDVVYLKSLLLFSYVLGAQILANVKS